MIAPDAGAFNARTCWHAGAGCEQQFLARLEWLGSAENLDLGIGKNTWNDLIEAGYIRGLLDWLDRDAQRLAQVPGLGKARATSLAIAFQRARERSFRAWMRALGATSVDAGLMTDWSTVAGREAADWRKQGVDPARAAAVEAFVRDPEVVALAQRLRIASVDGFELP